MNGLRNALERILSRFFDIQGSSETQVAQNVKYEAVAPFCHVFGLGPLFTISIREELIPTINMLLDKQPRGSYRFLVEDQVQNPSLFMVERKIACVNSSDVRLIPLPDFVALIPPYVRFGGIYIAKGLAGHEGNCGGIQPDSLS